MNELDRFLCMAFSHVPPGVIEVRLIPEPKDRGANRRAAPDRRWFDSPEMLIRAVPCLLQESADEKLAVCFGVLPRSEPGRGRSRDVLPGRLVWADLDYKDYAGGEEEARERLRRFEPRPSAIVYSGHGLHCYWVIDEPAASDGVCAVSQRFGQGLDGDSVADPARVMRLPTSRNWKESGGGILTKFEELAIDRVYDLASLQMAAAAQAVPSRAGPGSRRRRATIAPRADTPVSDNVPEGRGVPVEILQQVFSRIRTRKKLRDLYFGVGKPTITGDGAKLDTSQSGYDYSLLHELLDDGIDDRQILAEVLRTRPLSPAHRKGDDYVQRTVDSVMVSREEDGGDLSTDFVVDHVRLFNSNPPIIELVISGQVLSLSHTDLASPSRFRVAFLGAIHRLPRVPGRGEAWDRLVEAWLAGAEKVEMPPEASPALEIEEAILEAVDRLLPGECDEDLGHGKAILRDGRKHFRTGAVRRHLQDSFPDVATAVICKNLRDNGFENKPIRLGDRTVRVWVAPSVTPLRAASEVREERET